MVSDGSVHLTVSGAVDAVSSCEFLDVLIGGISPGRTLIVDLTSVTRIDETGVAALAVVDRIAVLHDSGLRVVGCTGEAHHLLATIKTGLMDRTRPER
jgi:anti-anti-sigma regulatory factor